MNLNLQLTYFKYCVCLCSLILTMVIKAYAQDPPIGFDTDNIRKKTNALNADQKAIRDQQQRVSSLTPENRAGSLPMQTTLYNDVDFSSYELLNANLSFSDKNSTQKIVFAPFKLLNIEDPSYLINNFRTNFALKDGVTTIGASIGQDNSAKGSKKSKRLLREFYDNNPLFQRYIDSIARAPNDSVRKPIIERYKNALKIMPQLYNETKLQQVFKWSISLNSQYFSVLSSRDNTTKFDSANYYGHKGTTLSASIIYGVANNSLITSVTYNRVLARLSAVQGQEKVDYNGYSISVNLRLFKFGSLRQIKNLEIYKKNFFIPALHIGCSLESKYSLGPIKFSEDEARQKLVYTPFVDIYLSPSSQFRLTFPITHIKRPDKESGLITGIGIQYAFKIVNLSE